MLIEHGTGVRIHKFRAVFEDVLEPGAISWYAGESVSDASEVVGGGVVSLGEGEGEEMLSINFDGGSKPINLYCRMGAGDSRVTFLGIFILSIGWWGAPYWLLFYCPWGS